MRERNKFPVYGENIKLSMGKLLAEEDKIIIQSFDCGNEVINSYLKEHADQDPQSTTFVIYDLEKNLVVSYYSLSCSGFVLNLNSHITIYPAVEIKMFAVDEKYKHMLFSQDDEFTLSDYIFSHVIAKIYDFTEKTCGADKIILYAVPQAENFYIKNGFTRFQNFMLQSESKFLDGCIPMYMDL
ncbi:MAG: hypothetical protein K2H82_02270 [Oscillospiraceae bacterium]|nr:hypothetical protein [Oscillospiraceae bacterium]